MNIHKTIANRILSLCVEHKCSTNELAKRAGLRQSTVHSIISGKSKNPNIETLCRIALYGFGMDLDEFFDTPGLKSPEIDV